ncbi:MAG: sulfatase-like hydrolase/transferase [Acidobacteria bacterium]|nr:sulfatase-like hydrolase/transferase [Acidobacteriota bacterium]
MSRIVPLLLAACLTAAAADKPNIVLLFADDQRADTIGAWGNPHIQTPNLDRLAREGFSFKSNYCLGGNSGAVCVPSRAMLNSGKAYFRIPMDLDGEKTLGEMLRQTGYKTYGIGKWHNQRPAWLRSFDGGKNVMFGGMSDHTNVPVEDLGPDGKLKAGDNQRRFSSRLYADTAIDFLESYHDDAPFFLYVAFTAPHDPRQPPLRYRQMYYSDRPPLPRNFLPQHPFDNGNMAGRDEELGAWPRTTAMVSDQLAEYYGMVTHLDEQVGRVLQALEAHHGDQPTYVVYAADHGLAVGSHGLLGKQNIYEHSMRAPLIVRGPDVPAGGSSETLTYLLDIFPTLAGVAGASAPQGLDGADLRPIWLGRSKSVRDSLFLSFRHLMRSVRDERWKLIRYPQINHTQLFDLQSDPYEMKNLAEDPAQASRVSRMMGMIADWQKKLGDDQPLSVANPQPKEIDMTGHKRTPDRWQPMWLIEKYFPDWL